jgi:pyruvate,water dikinase
LQIEISNRKRDFLKFEHDVPPKFLLNSHEFNDVLKYSKDCSIFQGIPSSHGIITGKIHIIRTINQISTVKANEILVVPRTDPGWTPVFSKIGGLITETGGVLSHGAVVSREYGIPAVTNVPNACKLFKNGQIVNMNGYNGIIKIKN